jgi:AraC-like DNA-binding protein
VTKQTWFEYAEQPSPPGLADWVQCLWSFDARNYPGEVYDHHVPPDGCVSLLVRTRSGEPASPVIILGPRCEPLQVRIEPGICCHGIRFLPHAARQLLADRLDATVGKSGPLLEFDPGLAESLALEGEHSGEQDCKSWYGRLQQVLPQCLSSRPEPEPAASRAVEQLVASHGQLPIDALARQLGISLRHLQRVFKHACGLTPKQFARIRRFRAAAAEILRQSPRPWCQVALDSGYSDQSHLTREFSLLLGLSAGELELAHKAIFHISVTP